jgi:glycosyltransferase
VLARVADDRSHVVSEPDEGLYDALNKGLARTSGEVVGLLHSDDLYAAPDVLACVMEAFADPGVDAVYGDLKYVAKDDPGRTIRTWRSRPFSPALLRRGWMPPHPTVFLRRRVIEKCGLFDTRFRISADYDAMLRYFSSPGFKAVHLRKTFVLMRTGGASNGSLKQIVRKTREDSLALKANGQGTITTLAIKNFRKLSQYL